MIVVLDYGINNLRSVQKAVEFLGYECRVQPHLRGASRAILPGVGAFGKAMEELAPAVDDIREFAASGKPLLGICLGQQLLFESSEEFGSHNGLGLIRGKVVRLEPGSDLKVPHIGWSPVMFRESSVMGRGIEPCERVYFVHSLYTVCNDHGDIAATTKYGVEFASAVQRDNVFGTQFHPEKSGEVGLRILRNFLEC